MRTSRLFLPTSLLCFGAVALTTSAASAQELRYHLDASSARAAGGAPQSEFGLGAAGEIAIELPFTHMVGGQLEVGGIWLSHGDSSSNPAIQSKGDGEVAAVMAGFRFHPARVAGLWVDANLGAAATGPLARPAMDAHIGFDVRVGGEGSRWDVGPFIGYEEIFEPSDGAFPDDARVFLFGAHIAFGAPRPPAAPAPRAELAKVAPPPAQEAPAPLPIPAPAVLTDLDGDGVLDLYDACPTVPGVATDDAETRGCPAAANGVSVQMDEIVLFDRIFFDTDRARIKHVSWPVVGALADFITSHPELAQVSIEGHADEIGEDDYNDALSRARAEAVKQMLVERFHVDERVVVLRAWGESRPADPGHSERAHAKNRRVEFFITRVRSPDQSAPPSRTAMSSGAEQ